EEAQIQPMPWCSPSLLMKKLFSLITIISKQWEGVKHLVSKPSQTGDTHSSRNDPFKGDSPAKH
ncbi:MAG: hypothetical protein J2P36_00445, partial [Ktedonobacteraceae bacterium]|nr:hypothetical protein [Ktedonobacteraceae bacterium]